MMKKDFDDPECGATAFSLFRSVCYGLIAALIAIAATTAMQGLGNQISNTFNKVTGTAPAAAVKAVETAKMTPPQGCAFAFEKGSVDVSATLSCNSKMSLVIYPDGKLHIYRLSGR